MFGVDEISTYNTIGSALKKGKTIQFNLNSSFNDVYYLIMLYVLWRLLIFQQLQESKFMLLYVWLHLQMIKH